MITSQRPLVPLVPEKAGPLFLFFLPRAFIPDMQIFFCLFTTFSLPGFLFMKLVLCDCCRLLDAAVHFSPNPCAAQVALQNQRLFLFPACSAWTRLSDADWVRATPVDTHNPILLSSGSFLNSLLVPFFRETSFLAWY